METPPTGPWMDKLDALLDHAGLDNVLAGIQLYCLAQGVGAEAGPHWMARAAAIESCRQKVRKDGKP